MEENIKKAQVIGITLSSFPEVDTWELIEELWARGKQVVVPKCNPSTRSMTFYQIDSFDQLEVVYMNLQEPIPALTQKVIPSNIDMLIVPGVVFISTGYRIGFGGGYYDRFLSDYNNTTLSMAFDCQVVETIPVEEYDLPVKWILTETRIIECSKAK